MDILFRTKTLRKLCEQEKTAKRTLGAAGAKKLRTRLAELRAAGRVGDLVAGRPHPLGGDRLGQFALDLDGGRRLVLAPAEDPPPTREDGAVDWSSVSRVIVTFIGDYHD